MPRMQISITFELTHALLLVDLACAFEMVGHVQQSVRNVRRMVTKVYIEKVRGIERDFEHLTKCEDISRRPCAFFASLATAPLSRIHQSRCGLHMVVAAFWLSVFTSIFHQLS